MELPTLPNKVICLTEESAELLYLLGEERRIAGVSAFAMRPEGIKKKHPVVSVFTHAQVEKIKELSPDLVIGYSDIQKDIARDLIDKGHNVWISNHRSLQEVVNYCLSLATLVGAQDNFFELLHRWEKKIEFAQSFSHELSAKYGDIKIYIEEWDEPRISGIHYFSELLELCGLKDINSHLRDGFKAHERFPDESHILSSNPDIIFGCWCGKKVDIASIKSRKGWEQLNAVKKGWVFELPPEIFLQPGPALFEDGIDYIIELLRREL